MEFDGDDISRLDELVKAGGVKNCQHFGDQAGLGGITAGVHKIYFRNHINAPFVLLAKQL
jgi:hypothetical protein